MDPRVYIDTRLLNFQNLGIIPESASLAAASRTASHRCRWHVPLGQAYDCPSLIGCLFPAAVARHHHETQVTREKRRLVQPNLAIYHKEAASRTKAAFPLADVRKKKPRSAQFNCRISYRHRGGKFSIRQQKSVAAQRKTSSSTSKIPSS
jgi:hypothetical protein